MKNRSPKWKTRKESRTSPTNPSFTPSRWGKTYRAARRNKIKGVHFKVEGRQERPGATGTFMMTVKVIPPKIWGSIYYSERHYLKPEQEKMAA